MDRPHTLLDIDGTTVVVGVMAWPTTHTLSPPMHNAAFQELGMNWVYVPYEVHPQDVEKAVAGIKALGIRGMNVTIPHKEAVAGLMDELSEEAQALGAVNTIDNVDGKLVGYNTDGAGFVRSLREAGEAIEGKRVALLGAGGAARAVALACARQAPAGLSIINRTLSRAEELAELLRRYCRPPHLEVHPLDATAQQVVADADILVNTTPVGMYPRADVPPVVPAEWLHPGQVVYDLIYNPRQTTLLQAARRAGCRTIDGTGMLVHQGAIAFERWTGRKAPVEVMRKALLGALAERAASSVNHSEDTHKQ